MIIPFYCYIYYTRFYQFTYIFYIVSFNYIYAFKSLLSLIFVTKNTHTQKPLQQCSSQPPNPNFKFALADLLRNTYGVSSVSPSELMWTTSKVTGSCSGNSMDARTQLSTKLWHLCGKMGLNDHLRSLILMDVPTQNGGRTSEHFPGPLRLLRCRLGMPILLQPYQVVLRTIRPHSYRTHRLLVSKVSAHYFLFCFFHNDVSLENVVGEICV